MNRIEKLIEEMCPEGVRQESILAVADYVRGLTYSKSNEDPDGPIGVLRSNNISERSSTLLLDDVKSLAPEIKVNDKHRLKRDDVLMSAASGSRKHVGKVAFINEDLEYYFGGFMAVLRSHEGLNPRFLFHILTSYRFSRFLEDTISSTTINTINSSTLKGFMIPLPPLEIQKEIVNILDKQYEEVRRRLLDFESDTSNHPLGEMIREMCPEGVRRSVLGEVIDHLRTGLNPRSNFKLNEDGADNSYVTVRELDGFNLRISSKTDKVTSAGLSLIQARSQLKPGDVLFSGTGTIGRTSLVDEVPTSWNIKEGVYAITPNKELLDSRFLIYTFHSRKTMNQINSVASGSTVRSISFRSLEKIQISVPPLEIQKEIVRILDNLDSLVNSVNEGIPAEVAARRKQYEYYRDKLLTFKELDAA
jgi:type I restriction enzyme S subunit